MKKLKQYEVTHAFHYVDLALENEVPIPRPKSRSVIQNVTFSVLAPSGRQARELVDESAKAAIESVIAGRREKVTTTCSTVCNTPDLHPLVSQ